MTLLVFVAWLALGLLLLVTLLVARRAHAQARTRLGSAQFAHGRALRAYRRASPLLLGRARGRRIYLGPRHLEGHITVLGPTRRGKTTRVLLPALLRERGAQSLVIADPKGELFAQSAGAVSAHHRVLVFAPYDLGGVTETYNPLQQIATMEQARDLASAVIENTGVSKEPFWDRNAESLITATVLHLRATAPAAPYCALADLLMLPIAQLKGILLQSPDPIAGQLGIATFDALEKAERTGGGIKLDLVSRFFPLLSPQLRQVTARSSFPFAELSDHPTALYLVVPHERHEQARPLVSLLLLQLFETLITSAHAAPRQRLARAVVCYLDEFYNLGTIPRFPTYISTLGGYGVSLVLALQNLSQLTDRYGEEGKQTILANTNTHLLLPGLFEEDSAWYSRALGERTVLARSASRSRPAHAWLGLPAGPLTRSQTRSEQRRPLLSADELERLRPNELLVRARGEAPLIVRTRAAFEDRRLRARLGLPLRQQPGPLPPPPQLLMPPPPPGSPSGSPTPALPPDDVRHFHLP